MNPAVARITVTLAITLIAACCLQGSMAVAADQTRTPNVILILMDDMGWRDVGFMGNTFVETPHIDAMAKKGLVFTQAYASAPNCAPTRACLMSGQYTPRHGIYTVVDPRQPAGSPWHKLIASQSESELATGVVTIAESLKSGGYATGFFGMWNLGRGRSGPVTPGGQGFDTVVFPETIQFGKDAYFDDAGNYLSDRLTDEVLAFVEKNRDRPFFAYLPDHAVHAPYDPKPDLLAKYEAKAARSDDGRNNPAHAATVEAVDQNVGRITAAIDRLELSDNTIVIFTSDNGGTQQFTPPLRGGKGELYEGGIRVPLVVSWAGLKAPGSTSAVAVSSIDLYPTVLDLAGLPAPEGQQLDGMSLVPVFQGAGTLPRPRLFWHFPCYVGRATPSSAVREGDFKLIEFFEDGVRVELYNLRDDPHEERNLAAKLPAKAATLSRSLHDWQRETGAAIPGDANPAYDPQAERPRGSQPGSQRGQPGGQGGQRAKAGRGGSERRGRPDRQPSNSQ